MEAAAFYVGGHQCFLPKNLCVVLGDIEGSVAESFII